nr:hypothetical protein Iba_scaffold51379CG0010 [Ipomoea batatas]
MTTTTVAPGRKQRRRKPIPAEGATTTRTQLPPIYSVVPPSSENKATVVCWTSSSPPLVTANKSDVEHGEQWIGVPRQTRSHGKHRLSSSDHADDAILSPWSFSLSLTDEGDDGLAVERGD